MEHIKLDKLKRRKLKDKPLKILVIPDMQIKPGIDLRFAHAIGCYLLAKKPDVVVNLGDMADMPSLSSYDKGKRSAEGQRYYNDVQSAVWAQELLWAPTKTFNVHQTKKRAPTYDPLKVFLTGNHEDRANRATQLDPAMYGTIDITKDLELHKYWDEVYDFMEVTTLGGVSFSHYFGTGIMNRPCGTAQQQLSKLHVSCISGHQPGRQTFSAKTADGRLLTSIIAGSSYDYDLDYMGPQGNRHWRGIILLHSAFEGQFDEVYAPTRYLKDKFSNDIKPIIFKGK